MIVSALPHRLHRHSIGVGMEPSVEQLLFSKSETEVTRESALEDSFEDCGECCLKDSFEDSIVSEDCFEDCFEDCWECCLKDSFEDSIVSEED